MSGPMRFTSIEHALSVLRDSEPGPEALAAFDYLYAHASPAVRAEIDAGFEAFAKEQGVAPDLIGEDGEPLFSSEAVAHLYGCTVEEVLEAARHMPDDPRYLRRGKGAHRIQ